MTTSKYNDYSFPQEGIEFPAVEGRHFQAVQDAVTDAFARERVVSCEARLAWLVNRKGYADYQSITGERNTYRNDDSDLVVQISVRISGYDINRGVVEVSKLIETLNEEYNEAKIAAAKEAAAKAKEAYEARIADLERLGGSL